MLKIQIKYSIEYEVGRILYTIKKIDWYLDNSYKINTESFPKNLLPNKRIIKRYVLTEYKDEDYIKNIEYLQKRWLDIEPGLFSKMEKLGIKVSSKFVIYFTKYGVAGSYDEPNIIIVNIRNFFGDGLLRNIIHELIHLIINPYILKYKLDHWQKERIVDLIFLDFFPQLSKAQSIPIDTSKIDHIFYKNYPNIKKIIIKVSKIK